MTQVFLLGTSYSATGSFPDPGNWNPTNTIEVLGAGDIGHTNSGTSGGPLRIDPTGEPLGVDPFYANPTGPGGGGGGGAYAVQQNWMGLFPVTYLVSAKVPQMNMATANYYASYWNWTGSYYTNWPTVVVPGMIIATDGICTGSGGSQNYGGSVAGTYSYPAGYPGGAGATATNGTTNPGGGGGGAGGPHGAGSAGAASGVSGAGDGGTVAGVAAGVNGNSSTYWDATHGIGSGGGGGTSTVTKGGTGGMFGAGGGGAYGTTTTTTIAGSAGGDGLIVLTYVPYVPPTPAAIFLMAA